MNKTKFHASWFKKKSFYVASVMTKINHMDVWYEKWNDITYHMTCIHNPEHWEVLVGFHESAGVFNLLRTWEGLPFGFGVFLVNVQCAHPFQCSFNIFITKKIDVIGNKCWLNETIKDLFHIFIKKNLANFSSTN